MKSLVAEKPQITIIPKSYNKLKEPNVFDA